MTKQVSKELKELYAKLETEVRMIDGVVLTATLNYLKNAPEVTSDIFTEAWKNEEEVVHKYLTSINEGDRPSPATVYARSASGSKVIEMTDELMDAVGEFESYIENTYARPIMKLKRKKHLLREKEAATKALEQIDSNKPMPF